MFFVMCHSYILRRPLLPMAVTRVRLATTVITNNCAYMLMHLFVYTKLVLTLISHGPRTALHLCSLFTASLRAHARRKPVKISPNARPSDTSPSPLEISQHCPIITPSSASLIVLVGSLLRGIFFIWKRNFHGRKIEFSHPFRNKRIAVLRKISLQNH